MSVKVKDDDGFGGIVFSAFLVVAILSIPLCMFTDVCKRGNEDTDHNAQIAVEAFGLSDVVMRGGYQMGSWVNGCDSHDSFARRFEATNIKGQRVHGVACGGFFKEWTIRISH